MSINDMNGKIFVKGAAWHTVGIRNETGQSAEATAAMFKEIPVFEKWPVWIGLHKMKTNDYAIVRLPMKDDPEPEPMGYCTKSYNIVQPADLCALFDKKVGQPVESMGFLGKGEKQFLSWMLPKSRIIVGGKDEVDLFGAMLAGFDAKVSISLMIASYRPVCENTFMSLLQYSKENQSAEGSEGRVFVGHHNSPNILRDLGAWMSHIQKEAERRAGLLNDFFNQIAAFPIKTERTLADILFNVYPKTEMPSSYPDELKTDKEKAVAKANELAARDRSRVADLFNGQGTAIDVTGYGLFNAVTEYESVLRQSKKDATESILFGERSKTMNRALMTIYSKSIGK